jgi:hypothetical protein
MRLICLAQVSKASRGRQPSPAKKRASKAQQPRPQAYTFLERVPLRLSAHKPVWEALRRHATRLPIVDAEHPKDAFPADVIPLDQLSGEAWAALSLVLMERRALALDAEKQATASEILSKPLDPIFAQELEWLSLRNLLAAAMPRTPAKPARARNSNRALLLLDF